MGSFATTPSGSGKGGYKEPSHADVIHNSRKNVGLTEILEYIEKMSDYKEAIKDEKETIQNAEQRIKTLEDSITKTRTKLREKLASLDSETKSLLQSSGIIIDLGETLDDLIEENKSYRTANKIFKNREDR